MNGCNCRVARSLVVSSLVTLVGNGCAHPHLTRSLQAIPPDTRLRVELPGPRTSVLGRRQQAVTGRLVASDSTSLAIRVRDTDPAIAIPLASVRAAYASDGPRSRFQSTTVGGLRGGMIGLVSGAVMAAFVSSTDVSANRMILGRAAGGAALGMVIGYIVPGERWRRVSVAHTSP